MAFYFIDSYKKQTFAAPSSPSRVKVEVHKIPFPPFPFLSTPSTTNLPFNSQCCKIGSWSEELQIQSRKAAYGGRK